MDMAEQCEALKQRLAHVSASQLGADAAHDVQKQQTEVANSIIEIRAEGVKILGLIEISEWAIQQIKAAQKELQNRRGKSD